MASPARPLTHDGKKAAPRTRGMAGPPPEWAKEQTQEPVGNYTKVPNVLLDELPEKATRLGISVVLKFWRLTAGGTGRPAWICRTYEEIAELVRCDPDAARKEIDALCAAGILEKKDQGIYRYYRVLTDGIAAAPYREQRAPAVKKEPQQAEESRTERPEWKPLVLTPGSGFARPIPLKTPVRGIEFVCECNAAVELDTIWNEDNDALRFVLRDVVGWSAGKQYGQPSTRNTGSTDPVLTNRQIPPPKNANTGSVHPELCPQVVSNQHNVNISELRDAINDVFAHRCGHPIDDGLLKEIHASITTVTVDQLREGLPAKANGKRKIAWGLVPLMVADIDKAHYRKAFRARQDNSALEAALEAEAQRANDDLRAQYARGDAEDRAFLERIRPDLFPAQQQ
jgi:hypothetical protein